MLKWGIAAVLAGGAVYAISQGKLESQGKFLGVFEQKDGFGLDDIAKGGAILGVAALGAMLVHKLAPGTPAPAVG